MMAAPYFYIFDLIFRLLFPSPPKEFFFQLIAIIYLTTFFIIYIVLIIYAWKWLKKNNLDKIICEWKRLKY